jgi:hypothetical protein
VRVRQLAMTMTMLLLLFLLLVVARRARDARMPAVITAKAVQVRQLVMTMTMLLLFPLQVVARRARDVRTPAVITAKVVQGAEALEPSLVRVKAKEKVLLHRLLLMPRMMIRWNDDLVVCRVLCK